MRRPNFRQLSHILLTALSALLAAGLLKFHATCSVQGGPEPTEPHPAATTDGRPPASPHVAPPLLLIEILDGSGSFEQAEYGLAEATGEIQRAGFGHDLTAFAVFLGGLQGEATRLGPFRFHWSRATATADIDEFNRQTAVAMRARFAALRRTPAFRRRTLLIEAIEAIPDLVARAHREGWVGPAAAVRAVIRSDFEPDPQLPDFASKLSRLPLVGVEVEAWALQHSPDEFPAKSERLHESFSSAGATVAVHSLGYVPRR